MALRLICCWFRMFFCELCYISARIMLSMKFLYNIIFNARITLSAICANANYLLVLGKIMLYARITLSAQCGDNVSSHITLKMSLILLCANGTNIICCANEFLQDLREMLDNSNWCCVCLCELHN